MTKQRTRPGLAFTLMAAAVLLALPATALAERSDRRHRSDTKAEERHRIDDREERHEARAGHRNDREHRQERARDAEHARHDRRHFSRHDRHHSSRHVRHDRHDRRHFSRHDREHRRASKHEHRSGYYCKPCRNHFGSRKGFYNHVHSAHHVPVWRLPRVVVSHGPGWVFFG